VVRLGHWEQLTTPFGPVGRNISSMIREALMMPLMIKISPTLALSLSSMHHLYCKAP
jgi:hypothetical protein